MPNSDTERKRKAGRVGGSVPRRVRLTLPSPSSPAVTRNIAKYPGLCDRCARLDLDTIFSSRCNDAREGLVAILSAVSTWSTASCSFCRLMSQAFDLGHYPNYRPRLLSRSTKRLSDLGWSSIGNKTLLTLSGGAWLVQQAADKKGPIRRLKHNEIDFGILGGWVTMCQQLHTKTCAAAMLSATTVPFFKLIDCETRKITPGPNEPYVALSYLWGTVKPPKSPVAGHLPDNLPKTMEDSISVTRKLGFRYLWIDAYCIDQDREDEKAAQIPKMDLIYQNAAITIIACAGNDSDYGLPGVGSRHRLPQAEASMGKHLIVSALDDPREFIENSKWATRAWTYQEGILSRRRLVFTDEQAYFECNGMYCCESMDLPLVDLHTNSRQSFKRIFWRGSSIGFFPHGSGRSQWEMIERIQDYSIRSSNLTDPSDILKGILGILYAFSRGNLELRHYQGIPLLQPHSKVGRVLRDIWTPSMSFFSGLCWKLRKESSRRY
jgi:hypothetical protein